MKRRTVEGIIIATLACVFAVSLLANPFACVPSGNGEIRVGAYYYIWWGLPSPYVNHWKEGVRYTPFLGEYNSSDPSVADKHIVWAKQHGIDFFAVSWLGRWSWWDHRYIDNNLKQGLLKAEHLDNFKFCLFYESVIVLNATLYAKENFTKIFIEDMEYAAENYFDHPSYLRIHEKPALFIYNVPYIYDKLGTTNARKLFDGLKKRINVYIVGDLPSPPAVDSPYLYSMNAVTSYFFLSPSNDWDTILDEARSRYPKWKSSMNSIGVGFIPNVYPGFDNTEHMQQGVLLPLSQANFEEMLRIACENVDDDLKMVMVTSWNEWLESTSIEPSMERGEEFLHTVLEVKQTVDMSDEGNSSELYKYAVYVAIGVVLGIILGALIAFATRRTTLKPFNVPMRFMVTFKTENDE